MKTLTIILLIVLAVLALILVALIFLGKRAEKKQAEQQEAMDAVKQTITMLIIDKKKMKIKDAGLPDAVLNQTPWYLRATRVPIIKAKVGPQIMTFIADITVFDIAPVKKEVKADVSGIYVTRVSGLHGKATVQEEKKGFFKNLVAKAQEKAGAKMVK